MTGPEASREFEMAAGGNASAIETLLLRHLPHLERYLGKHVGARVAGQESIADLVQSVCREALERAADERLELRGDEEFRSWLYRAAMLKILNRHRFWRAGRREVERNRPLADVRDDTPTRQLVGSDPTPSSQAIRSEEIDRFAAAFGQLEPDQQAIILLAHVEGLPHDEIGQRLQISPAHSRTRLSRALSRLATLATAPK